MQQLSILMTSDTHGFWIDSQDDPNRSLRNTARAIRELRAQKENPTLTIDLGDFIQGSSFATYCKQVKEDGRVFARAMNALGYDYQLIGNHEFNFGQAYRDQILAELKAPILCANIVDAQTGEPALGEPYAILEREGIKIGIIGLTTPYIPHWELPAHYEGLAFLSACSTARKYIEILRPQVDVLIVAYHGGFESDLTTFEPLEAHTGENEGAKMLQDLEGIDVLLTGHQHRAISQRVGNTWTVQPGFAGKYVAEVTLTLDENKRVVDGITQLHDSAEFERDSEIEAVLQPELAEGQAWLTEVLGQAPLTQVTNDPFEARLYGHPYIEFLNELQLRETGADFSAVALVNQAFEHFHGDITNEILLNSYPYYNLMAMEEVTGETLRQAMEFNLKYLVLDDNGQKAVNPTYIEPKPKHYNFDIYSGILTTVDMTQPAGQRVVKMVSEKTGELLEADKVYKVALSQYRACGGGDYAMYRSDMMKTLSTVDIATRMKEAVANFTAQDWEKINTQYKHFEWL